MASGTIAMTVAIATRRRRRADRCLMVRFPGSGSVSHRRCVQSK